ncbi:voltage-gated chloride channel family protein [Paenibacillus sp. OV219]|uniref:voltage-gated chloride channel family protein n=1 Tax=Paenibacillus sp. OV219 TaxID=1884377 RepID=UPI0008C031FF|nr:voltage-gated chloride channel family protein [Paenibacillus sp. OV219]SEM87046.1 H+/Cl-antiporter ClcA [Paenibacillus sp. OV219]
MRTIINWVLYGLIVGVFSGLASALFLAGLDAVTNVREAHAWLLFLLPLAGAMVSYGYMRWGGAASRGNNLIVEQIRSLQVDRVERVPLRMAPMILLGTWVTHLFGGSAGREGTAVQMGGSLADLAARFFRADAVDRRILLLCGLSGGFGAVFGTPLAGAVFALEVVTLGGRMAYKAIVAVVISAFVGDWLTRAVGIKHLSYSMGGIPSFSMLLLVKVAAAAICFGLMSWLFVTGVKQLKGVLSRIVPRVYVRSFIGGAVVIALVYIAGSRTYLGLSLPLLVQSFQEQLPSVDFVWKSVITVITLGSGFLGGEVTPLFVIGAALGNALAPVLHLSVPFLAGLGLIAVFAGAANTPLACIVLGYELFGGAGIGYMFVVCLISYMFSGHAGIYESQLLGVPKPRFLIRVPGAGLWLGRANAKKKGRTAPH